MTENQKVELIIFVLIMLSCSGGVLLLWWF